MSERNVHICADVRMINNSGIGVYIHHFIRNLIDNSGYNVTLLGRSRELNAYFEEGTYRLIEADFPIYSVQEQIKLPGLVPVCDVFWSPHYNVPLLPIRARKFLVTVPDVFHLAFYQTLSPAQKLYAKVVANVAVRKADRILTISQYSKQEIVRFTGIRPDKIGVIYLGIDKTLFRRVDDVTVQQQTRSRYQVPEQYILFVGNVKPNKNLRALVSAFALLLDKLPTHKLLIVGKKEGFIIGDSELFGRIEADARLRERVVFTGYVDFDDLPVLYSMASVFAFPSLYEGFGFPPLEAMACGCPVVASNRASIPEVSGEGAVYVDPDNTTQLADALYDVLTEAKRRAILVESGYKQIAHYDWEESGRLFVSEVDMLLK